MTLKRKDWRVESVFWAKKDFFSVVMRLLVWPLQATHPSTSLVLRCHRQQRACGKAALRAPLAVIWPGLPHLQWEPENWKGGRGVDGGVMIGLIFFFFFFFSFVLLVQGLNRCIKICKSYLHSLVLVTETNKIICCWKNTPSVLLRY